MLRSLLLLPLVATGCSVQAPETIEEMMVFGFERFGDEDPAALEALADQLLPWLDANFDEASEGYAIDQLTAESLAQAGIETDREGGIQGAVVGLDYAVTIDRLAQGLTFAHQDEIFSGYLEFETVEHHDRDCFLSMECERFDATDDIHSDLGVLGIESWSTMLSSMRWVHLDNGLRALANRNLGPDPITFNVDFLEVQQQYAFTYAFERPDGTIRRAQAIWVDGQVVGADMPEGFQVNIGINAMRNAAADLEAFLLDPENG